MSTNDKDQPKAAAATTQDRKALFEQLKQKRAMAHESNKKEVAEEATALQEDPKVAAKKQRQVAEAKVLMAKKEAEEKGLDYDRVRSWDMSIAEAQKEQRDKDWKEKNQDVGFSSYEESSLRKYKRLTRNMKPNLEEYVQQKVTLEEDFYPDVNNLNYGFYSKVPESKIDELVEDLKSQEDKRKDFSRRRRYDETAEVDYINERNARFNKKIARAFDPYTKDVKANLERGTAI